MRNTHAFSGGVQPPVTTPYYANNTRKPSPNHELTPLACQSRSAEPRAKSAPKKADLLSARCLQLLADGASRIDAEAANRKADLESQQLGEALRLRQLRARALAGAASKGIGETASTDGGRR